MTTRVGIRDLRNRTSEVIRIAQAEGQVIVTSNGNPVVLLSPIVDSWSDVIDEVFETDAAPYDSGLGRLLADDDALSMDDVD